MPARFNEKLLLWLVGVIQPATAQQLQTVLSKIFTDMTLLPSTNDLEEHLKTLNRSRLVAKIITEDNRLYSLTSLGNLRFPIALKRHRDKARLFLLKQARSGRFFMSGEHVGELAGGAPAADGSRTTQDSRPINPLVTRSISRARSSRLYWPQIAKQLTAGLQDSSPDIFYDYYSFPTIKSLHTNCISPAKENDLSLHDLALAIGISPRLLSSFIYAQKKHYRSFTIGKRAGGTRKINSPKLFLKVVQYWILDYLLFRLKIHPSCHSYQMGKSIITNASQHTGRAFVANVDIANFFGSIHIRQLVPLLRSNDFGEEFSTVVSRLLMLDDALPQGAPTSPIISNAFLYDFDENCSNRAKGIGLAYSRYADDITVSGDRKDLIVNFFDDIGLLLREKGLRANEKKTRIASRGGQQRVTGLVVNVHATPPRNFRRTVRAMFHNAYHNPSKYTDKLRNLQGYWSYLQSFSHLTKSKDLKKYKMTIAKLSKMEGSRSQS